MSTNNETLAVSGRSRKRRPGKWSLLTIAAILLASLVASMLIFFSPLRNSRALGADTLWNDDFNSTSLDTTKWNAPNSTGTVGQELASYTATNATVQGGLLSLKSEKRALNGLSYTSSAISSANTFSFLYGKVDIRAKLPAGQGVWPYLRLVGTKCASFVPVVQTCPSWPTPGAEEIDIAEARGQDTSTIFMSNHFGDKAGTDSAQPCFYFGPDFSANYHVFSLTWTANQLIWSIDGVQRCMRKNAIPNTPMFLLLGTAIGGSFVGSPDATTPLPQTTIIDYVHVTAQQVSTPTTSASTLYEAEDATLTGGAVASTQHTGYSGTGFVDGYSNVGASTAFQVTIPQAGNYQVTLHYANGSGSIHTLNIYVNGTLVKATNLNSTAAGDWNIWGNQIETLNLQGGNNLITYQYDSQNTGNINLDYILVHS